MKYKPGDKIEFITRTDKPGPRGTIVAYAGRFLDLYITYECEFDRVRVHVREVDLRAVPVDDGRAVSTWALCDWIPDAIRQRAYRVKW